MFLIGEVLKMRKKLLTLTTACLCILAILQCKALKQIQGINANADSFSLSGSQLTALKKMPVFGFRNIVANWSFVQFLQYFGDEDARRQTGYDDSPEYLSATIHNDPFFNDFYVFLSGSSTLYAGKPEKTISVMSEGLAQLHNYRAPDNYYIWRYKGTDELLFLNDGKSAQKSFKMAAEWASESSEENAVLIGKASQQTAQFLADNPDSKPAQINAWGNVLTTALDNNTRTRAVEKIRELGGDVFLTEDGEFKIKYSKSE